MLPPLSQMYEFPDFPQEEDSIGSRFLFLSDWRNNARPLQEMSAPAKHRLEPGDDRDQNEAATDQAEAGDPEADQREKRELLRPEADPKSQYR